MRRLNQVKLLSLVLMLALSLTTTACDVQSRADIPAPQPRNLSPASPEDAGMSTERLGRLSAAMQNIVDEGELAGMIQQFGQGRPDLRSLSRRLSYQAIVDSDS